MKMLFSFLHVNAVRNKNRHWHEVSRLCMRIYSMHEISARQNKVISAVFRLQNYYQIKEDQILYL